MEPRTNQADEWALVAFMCPICKTEALLHVRVLPNGVVDVSRPGTRKGIKHQLAEGTVADQRAEGVPLDRRGADRPGTELGMGRTISLKCDRCTSHGPYLVKRERIENIAKQAVGQRVSKVSVTKGGDLILQSPLG